MTPQHIRESNLIEGIDDPRADAQSMNAWLYLSCKLGLDLHTILQVQKLIVETQDTLTYHERGRLRTVHVTVGGRNCPTPAMVSHLMNNWLLDYKDRDPIVNHVAFEHIHPFVDGNGRTGRLLLWWQQIKNGQEPLLIKASETGKYYEWFK